MPVADMVWLSIALATAAMWVFALLMGERSRWRGPKLSGVAAVLPGGAAWPRVSLIIPALNEARGIEAAARSLLAVDYPELELIAVDDRSTDGTGEILDRLAGEDPRLQVVHVRSLPEGWLGKNHANHLGARRATGQWLLFLDADVILAPEAVKRAVVFALGHGLGHLTVMPGFIAPGIWEKAFVAAFGVLLSGRQRLWDLQRPRTSAYIGIGAFNLVRRSGYDNVGGHERLRLEVADDLKLGLLLRRSGVAQGAIDSGWDVKLRWQQGFFASIGGLVKNAFSGVEWSWVQLLGAVVPGVLVIAGPWACALAAPIPGARLAGVVGIACAFAAHARVVRSTVRGSGLECVLFPICGLLVLGVLVYSSIRAELRGGIEWRGTKYPIGLLRKGCVRAADFPVDRVIGWE